MRRREFCIGLGFVIASQSAIRAADKPRIGFLNNGSAKAYGYLLEAFRIGLKEAGYVEGQNVEIEYRWADGDNAVLPELVAQLQKAGTSVIVATGGTASAMAVKNAGLQIATVFVNGGDPVRFGLVQSLSRPGGNMTGATFLANSLIGKQVEILHEIIAKGSTIGYLGNPSNPNAEFDLREATEAAAKLGHGIISERTAVESEIAIYVEKLMGSNIAALLIAPDAMFTSYRQTIISRTQERKMATVYSLKEFAHDGGLVAYGARQTDVYRTAGNYTGRILRGQKPADLPVVQSSLVELVVNLKTAKLLGISIPEAILSRADEVIE